MSADEHMTQIRDQLNKLSMIPPFTVRAIDESTQAPRDWFFGGPDTVQALRCLDSTDLSRIRALIGPELVRWQRAAAASKRVWQHHDRVLREWKAAKNLELTTPPAGAEVEEETEAAAGKKDKKKTWKAPTVAVVEATYRVAPEYRTLNVAVERAEETYSVCLGIIDAWQTIGRLLAAK